MREHARKLLAAQHADDAARDGDGGVRRTAPRRKGVRRHRFDQTDLRHGQPRARRKICHKMVKFGRFPLRQRTRAVHAEHNAVAEPIGEEIHRQRDDEHHHRAALAADRAAQDDEKDHHERHQDRCFYGIHIDDSPFPIRKRPHPGYGTRSRLHIYICRAPCVRRTPQNRGCSSGRYRKR